MDTRRIVLGWIGLRKTVGQNSPSVFHREFPVSLLLASPQMYVYVKIGITSDTDWVESVQNGILIFLVVVTAKASR